VLDSVAFCRLLATGSRLARWSCALGWLCRCATPAPEAARPDPTGEAASRHRVDVDSHAVGLTDAKGRQHGSQSAAQAQTGATGFTTPDASTSAAEHPSDAADRDEAAALPPGVEPGELSIEHVPGHRNIYVVQGRATTRRALVYLPGMCGNILAMQSFSRELSARVTIVGLLGDTPCGNGRYKWSRNVPFIHERIQTALEHVKQQRGDRLDTEQVIAFGYSQGATRAQALAEAYPERYPWVVMGSAPVRPSADKLSQTRSVLLLLGSEEPERLMYDGEAALTAAGRRVRLMTLPGAFHGQYGTQGAEVVADGLDWLLAHDH